MIADTTPGIDGQVSTTDPDELKERVEQKRELQRDRRAAMRQQLSTPEGRRFVWELLLEGGLFEDIVGAPEHVFRALGRRSAALKLYAEATEHSDLYLLMQGEAVRRDRERKANRRRRTRNTESQTKPA